jgi:pimeloyl-ACP methyl ester carboxylesterase
MMTTMADPLLLIHGFTDTRATWTPLLPLLSEHHELLVPTLTGHRGGPPIPAGMSDPLATMADGLERVIDEAGHDRVHVVGNSLGGWLAFILATRGRALSVVALSPGHGWPEDAPPGATARQFRLARRMAPIGARHVRRIVTRPRLRKIAFRDVIAHGDRVPPATAAELILGAADCPIFEPYWQQVEENRYRDDFDGNLGVPTRIAWGTRDRTLPIRTTSAWFRDALPDAEWVDLEDCGHLPQHDDPPLVARTILEVTERAASPARA